MAAKPELSTLPAELRSEIWSLALLPSPGVYRCDPHRFVWAPEGPDRHLEVQDGRWLIDKRRWPTVAHLCRESRLFALGVRDKEARERSFFCCVGQDTRPFVPEIDTFWLDDDAPLNRLGAEGDGNIGSRVRDVQNLAVSAALVEPGRELWHPYLFMSFGRFESLRRVHVVFGPVPPETRCDAYGTDEDCGRASVWGSPPTPDEYHSPSEYAAQAPDGGIVVFTGVYDLPELRLVEATRASGVETAGSLPDGGPDRVGTGVVEDKLDTIRADVYKGFELRELYRAECRLSGPRANLPEPGQEKDLSQVTFHAARVVETARFRGRAVRKTYRWSDFRRTRRPPFMARPTGKARAIKKRTTIT